MIHDSSHVHRPVPEAGRRHQGLRPVRPHQLRADRRLPSLGIEYVSFRHEQLAAHAADAYYRVSHKLAVAERAPVARADERADRRRRPPRPTRRRWSSSAGNTPSYHHAREPHQGIRFHADASQGDIFRPICKRVWRVDDAKFLADVMPRALNLAQTGRPGPVLIDVPMDVFSQQIDVRGRHRRPPARIRPVRRARRRHRRRRAAAGVRRTAGDLRRQRRAAVGGDRRAASARGAARAFPSRTTLMGKGVVPGTSSAGARHERHLGHRRRQHRDARRRRRARRSARRLARPTAARGIRASPSPFRRRV